MNKLVLCLDIDDCLIPASSTYFGRFDDTLDIMAANMRRIKAMIEMFDMGVFITSSWYLTLKIDENNLLHYRKENVDDDNHLYKAFKLLRDGIGNRAIGLSCGDRRRDIVDLLKDEYKVIAMDDINLSAASILSTHVDIDKTLLNNNYLFLHVRGFITNEHTFMARSFLDKE